MAWLPPVGNVILGLRWQWTAWSADPMAQGDGGKNNGIRRNRERERERGRRTKLELQQWKSWGGKKERGGRRYKRRGREERVMRWCDAYRKWGSKEIDMRSADWQRKRATPNNWTVWTLTRGAILSQLRGYYFLITTSLDRDIYQVWIINDLCCVTTANRKQTIQTW